MSYLLFLDESGHDHRNCPYEIHGGVAIHASRLWSFVRDFQRLEDNAFGVRLSEYRHELKGSHLLDKDRFKWARQHELMSDEERRSSCRAFLAKGLQHLAPKRHEFTAYGQACLELVSGLFEILRSHGAVLFASVIPRKAGSHSAPENVTGFLRKDHVFLLERYFYFLRKKKEHGLLVMDETERAEDSRFIRRIESYFTKTQSGRVRAQWIVPSPLFVCSDLAYPIQAADICIYCINWGFRLPKAGMEEGTRSEVAELSFPWISSMQYNEEIEANGEKHNTYGIVYVDDPFNLKIGQQ